MGSSERGNRNEMAEAKVVKQKAEWRDRLWWAVWVMTRFLLLSCREEAEEGRSTWEGKNKKNKDILSLSLLVRLWWNPNFAFPIL